MSYATTAPFQLNPVNPELGFRAGFDVGKTWESSYTPGGPFVYSSENFGRNDPEWVAYCTASRAYREEWVRGFCEASGRSR